MNLRVGEVSGVDSESNSSCEIRHVDSNHCLALFLGQGFVKMLGRF